MSLPSTPLKEEKRDLPVALTSENAADPLVAREVPAEAAEDEPPPADEAVEETAAEAPCTDAAAEALCWD